VVEAVDAGGKLPKAALDAVTAALFAHELFDADVVVGIDLALIVAAAAEAGSALFVRIAIGAVDTEAVPTAAGVAAAAVVGVAAAQAEAALAGEPGGVTLMASLLALVDLVVAVVVATIAALGRPLEDARVVVVAVDSEAVGSLAVLVAVLVDAVGGTRQVSIDAVFVDAVAADLAALRVGRAHPVVAVGAPTLPTFAVPVAVAVETVEVATDAVVVEAVAANLGASRVHARVLVVAVGTAATVLAVAVTVFVLAGEAVIEPDGGIIVVAVWAEAISTGAVPVAVLVGAVSGRLGVWFGVFVAGIEIRALYARFSASDHESQTEKY